ncbi:MAG: hypothetical protein ABH827_00245 [bacterium]
MMCSGVSTYLIVGPGTSLQDYTESFIQKSLCPNYSVVIPDLPVRHSSTGATAGIWDPSSHNSKNKASCFCATCRKIKAHQYHALVWICPAQDYKIEDIDIIFEKVRFSLDPGAQFFFVLEKAETLSTIVANKLLKVLEEPPAGYNFILTTTNQQAILKTIFSRCFVIRLPGQCDSTLEHPVLEYFMYSYKMSDSYGFTQALRANRLSDTDSMLLADSLLAHFAHKVTEYVNNSELVQDAQQTTQYVQAQKAIEVITHHMRKPPQSGSSELFWKNLFLHFPRP